MKVKVINDYVDALHEKYPTISKADIKRILRYGWKLVYLLNSYGGDLVIHNRDFWAYFGNLQADSIGHFYYYIKKLCIKIRVLYKRKKILWDGYYYFALTNKLYELYLSLKNSKGRPRKVFTFENVYMYQILDECKLENHRCKYIFRIPYTTHIKYRFFKKTLKTDKAELIIEREPLKFVDIMTKYNNYDVL